MIELEIDGRKVEVPHGATVMDAANQLGIFIPYFCYHKKLSIAANCRMCLVEVEKAPKPLPACATPATPGMKVQTRSAAAKKAQNGVMEFLLINHPLDCPICDQGGECQLQDLAVGYGTSSSRYEEPKRVVPNKNLGPLIATDMTRCIHCTRCVRFGEEIAGVQELGMANRGEHAEILAFVGRTVDSELSGNVIDLCPVGALTSKPFRYTARTWELSRRRSVSPHDGLGANLVVQVKNDRVMRVLPRENDEVNECWLADRDRFSYEGLNAEDRLTQPMIRRGEEWVAADWQTALDFAVNALQRVRQEAGARELGALVSPHSTLEELYLAQKLMRGLGSGNVDHRLRQSDFSLDGHERGAAWLGQPVAAMSRLKSVLVVGSTLRKEQPLLAQRLRDAVKRGAALHLLNPVGDDLLTDVATSMVVPPAQMVNALARIARALAQRAPGKLAPEIAQAIGAVDADETAAHVADSLAGGAPAAVLLGGLAQHHPRYGVLRTLAQAIGELSGATVGVLGEAANSVGAQVAGALPHRGPRGEPVTAGMNARQMLTSPRRAYLLLNLEPELDAYDASLARRAMESADLVVALTAYRSPALDRAHVLLPIAPFSETSGTFVSMEGRVQSFTAVVRPLGEARPAWKVLRVLGNLLGVPGFEQNSAEQLLAEALGGGDVGSLLNNAVEGAVIGDLSTPGAGLQRIGEVPIYQLDPIVRRARSLQQTRDATAPVAAMHGAQIERLGLRAGEHVRLRQGGEAVDLDVIRDDRLPDGCVRVPAAHPATVALGGMLDELSAERVGG
ncbi:MAG: NADH-quinone oxidoreductase subunit NuoG [Pseudomonadota bacterium]